MTRFYSLHFGISLIMLVATELYFYKNRFNRLNLKWPARLALIAIIAIIAIIVPSETGSRLTLKLPPCLFSLIGTFWPCIKCLSIWTRTGLPFGPWVFR
jgi:hypothetical protein